MYTQKVKAIKRSYLFAPGNNEKLLGKVFDAGADAVVLDLEDAVPPSEKDRARELVRETLKRRLGSVRPEVYVRINHVSTPHWKKDIEAVLLPGLSGIRIPKAESAHEICNVDEALHQIELDVGLSPGALPITTTIESAAGVMNAEEIARAPRVQGFAYGATDLARDIGADPGSTEIETLFARSRLVLIARIAGIQPPIASVQTDLADEDRLRATTLGARRLGFFGRSCIHPKQLPVIHQVFTPSRERVDRAKQIVESYRKAKAAGSGAFQLPDGQFVDEAVALQAEAVVALAEQLQS